MLGNLIAQTAAWRHAESDVLCLPFAQPNGRSSELSGWFLFLCTDCRGLR